MDLGMKNNLPNLPKLPLEFALLTGIKTDPDKKLVEMDGILYGNAFGLKQKLYSKQQMNEYGQKCSGLYMIEDCCCKYETCDRMCIPRAEFWKEKYEKGLPELFKANDKILELEKKIYTDKTTANSEELQALKDKFEAQELYYQTRIARLTKNLDGGAPSGTVEVSKKYLEELQNKAWCYDNDLSKVRE